MMTNDEVGLDYNEAPLNKDQVSQIEDAVAELHSALAEVGAAHLEQQNAYRIFSEANRRLKTLESFANTAQARHDRLMADLAKTMDLPPGEWTYDKATSTLKKD